MGIITRNLLLPVILTVLPGLTVAQATGAVGIVLLTRGDVAAQGQGNVSRTLGRRSEIVVGDRITTGPAGFAQIRMVDNAIISLSGDTEFTIHDYFYDGEGGMRDKVRLELHRGGMRTIDGLITGSPDHDYLLVTPGMDIVPGGTTYECVVDNGKTFCGVYDGGITVSNTTGSFKLGLGGNWDFAEAQDRQSAIVPLRQAPAQLGGITVQQNPNTTVTVQRTPRSVAPLTNGVTFPAPTPIRVVPYRRQTP